jgi:hypothetical protein
LEFQVVKDHLDINADGILGKDFFEKFNGFIVDIDSKTLSVIKGQKIFMISCDADTNSPVTHFLNAKDYFKSTNENKEEEKINHAIHSIINPPNQSSQVIHKNKSTVSYKIFPKFSFQKKKDKHKKQNTLPNTNEFKITEQSSNYTITNSNPNTNKKQKFNDSNCKFQKIKNSHNQSKRLLPLDTKKLKLNNNSDNEFSNDETFKINYFGKKTFFANNNYQKIESSENKFIFKLQNSLIPARSETYKKMEVNLPDGIYIPPATEVIPGILTPNAIVKGKTKSKVYSDKKINSTAFHEGDKVLLINPVKKHKLDNPKLGPYVVMKINNDLNTTILVGNKLKRVHNNRLILFQK